MRQNYSNKLIAMIIAALSVFALSNCTNNSNSHGRVANDYSQESSLSTIEGSFAEAEAKIKKMLPIEIDETLNLTDFNITDKSVIYSCTFTQEFDFSQIDFDEILEEQKEYIDANMRSEQMRKMVKFCEATCRDIRYMYYSIDGELIKEQIILPSDYITE